MVGSSRNLGQNFDYLVREGTEQTVTLHGPDTCAVTCAVRPYTAGYILVVDTPYFAVTNATGHFTIRGVPAGEYQVTVWHEGAGKLTMDAGPTKVTITGKSEETLNYRVKPAAKIGK